MLKDENLSREEFFKNYTKEEIVSYIKELYNIGDNLELIRKEFNKINFEIIIYIKDQKFNFTN